jgi:hypothetical protein
VKVHGAQANWPEDFVDSIVHELTYELRRLLAACGYSASELGGKNAAKGDEVGPQFFPFEGKLAYGRVPSGRILQLWHCDPAFLDGRGNPLPLELSGPRSLETLVQRAECMLDSRVVCEALVDAKFAKMVGKKIAPLTRVALAGDRSKAGQVLLCLGDLARTLHFNLTDGKDPSKALFQRFASDTAVPVSRIEEFKRYFEKQAMALLTNAEEWLFRAEREANGSEEMLRVNVHVFLSPFEDVPTAKRRKQVTN